MNTAGDGVTYHVSGLADVRRTGDVRRALGTWAVVAGLPSAMAADMVLAVYEALANVLDHAYPGGAEMWFGLEARLRHDVLTVSVTDRGRWRPPRRFPDPLRGHGLMLIRSLSHTATVSPRVHGTTVNMVWFLRGNAPASGGGTRPRRP